MNEITVPDNKIKKVLKHSVSRKTAGSFCIGDRLKCGSVRSVDVSVINVKKIKDIVYDNFKDIFLDYSIDCITSHFEDRYFEKGDIFFLDIDLKEKNGIKIAEKNRASQLDLSQNRAVFQRNE